LNHSDSSSIFDLTLGEFLQQLGSPDPTPGGGAAAAVVGAIGAALVEMTANLTVGRPRLADVEDRAKLIRHRASELREQLERLGDADTAAFRRVSAAFRLQRADDAQKAARTEAIQAALRVAADVPLETVRIGAAVVDLAEEAAPILNPAVISDVLVGALLVKAAVSSAALNVEINVAAMTDSAAADRYSAELTRAQEGMDKRIERILAAGRSRFPRGG
jgi:formiminotetrahydrofolate cyclodeaminase